MYINRLRAEHSLDGTTVTLAGPCVVTKEEYAVTVSAVGYRQYVTGNVLAQKAFPNLSADDREFLISGTSPKGWAKLFPDEGDED